MPTRPQQPQNRTGKKTKTHKVLRVQVFSEEDICGICGGVVDFSLPGTDDWGPTLGHLESVRERPDLEFVRSNLELQHSRCNKKQGA